MRTLHVPKWLVGLLLVALLATACQPAATPAPTQAPAPTEAPAATQAPVDDEITVAFSGPPLLDDFQIQLFNGLKDKADELGVKLIHIEHGNDPAKQASDIEDLLTQDIDALLIAAANADAVGPSIDKAVEKGIPVFSIDNAAASDKVLNHSGNDLYCIGYRSAEYLANAIGNEGKILHINGFAGMALVTWNDDGVNQYLSEHPEIEKVMTGYADWDPARAQAITEDVLAANADLKGIYVISEVMTGGVVQALKAQELTDKIKVISGGFAPESQTWLADGELIAAFEWSSYSGAQAQMQQIYDYLTTGAEVKPFSPWPVTVHQADGETYELECPIGDWQP
ncbi:MAG: sugar ABC transporter substrate-binding protein [Anaerolineales bacterium]|nr:sugar ABC transporter substrate-binding protein [Anaerolineales bacterium]